jgi:hypothetical protein
VCAKLKLRKDPVSAAVAVERSLWRLALVKNQKRDWRERQKHSAAPSMGVARAG